MKTVIHPNGMSIAGKAWEIRAWFKQQLAKASHPHAPLLSAIAAQKNNDMETKINGQVIPFPTFI